MNNVMEYKKNHYQKLSKNIYMVRRWDDPMVWTGTNRISRYQLMDEFGETFTEFEFSKKIGSKDSVRNISHDIGQSVNLMIQDGFANIFQLNKANYEFWGRFSRFCSYDKRF